MLQDNSNTAFECKSRKDNGNAAAVPQTKRTNVESKQTTLQPFTRSQLNLLYKHITPHDTGNAVGVEVHLSFRSVAKANTS